MTRKRMLLGACLALAVAVVLLVLFVSRPRRAETLVAQIQIGQPVAEVEAILGPSELPVGYIWTVEGEEILVDTDQDQVVTSVELRTRQASIVTWMRTFIGID